MNFEHLWQASRQWHWPMLVIYGSIVMLMPGPRSEPGPGPGRIRPTKLTILNHPFISTTGYDPLTVLSELLTATLPPPTSQRLFLSVIKNFQIFFYEHSFNVINSRFFSRIVSYSHFLLYV